MTHLLEQVIEQLRQLPDEEQDDWARELLEELRDQQLVQERTGELKHARQVNKRKLAQAEALRAEIDGALE